jgi:hypothetical protein
MNSIFTQSTNTVGNSTFKPFWLPLSERSQPIALLSFDFKVSLYTLMQYNAELNAWNEHYERLSADMQNAHIERMREKQRLQWAIDRAVHSNE